jgi:Predicted nucleic acid-binding protein, contains PIN domain
MIKVICNSSPIIGLSVIGKLNLLWEIFDEVIIPKEVYREVVEANFHNNYGAKELEEAVNQQKIGVYNVKNKTLVDDLYGKLHRGELEVIVAARELKVTDVVIDEKAARSFAGAMLLQSIGIIGVLIIAKKKGKITELKKYLDSLVKSNYRISKKLYENALRKVGELD